MTNRDESSDELSSKGFLERWSRKKIDAERETPAAENTPGEMASGEPRPSETGNRDSKTPVQTGPKAEFDLSSLPSLESITAATDIRAFLMPGVPQELARAALRRAWAADPAIRDFVGLAENDWDFTDPNAMAGFGALPEGFDVKKLIAQIFSGSGESADAERKVEQIAEAQPGELTSESSTSQASPEGPAAAPDAADRDNAGPAEAAQKLAQADIVQRDNNIAAHKDHFQGDAEERKTLRQHGSALPQ